MVISIVYCQVKKGATTSQREKKIKCTQETVRDQWSILL